MGRTASEYLKLLQSLLPKGSLWNRTEDSVLTQTLQAEADELARIEDRAEVLFSERDTRYTTELLQEFEVEYGLPDECSEAGATISERRSDVRARFLAVGQQYKQYFIDLAAALGYEVEIDEHSPFWAGIGHAGMGIGPQANIFYWTVRYFYQGNVIYFEAGSSAAGDQLAKRVVLESLQCLINRYKPGHTVVLFEETGPGFDQGFSQGFQALAAQGAGYLAGGFDKGFSIGFDVNWGGGFDYSSFSSGFDRPA